MSQFLVAGDGLLEDAGQHPGKRRDMVFPSSPIVAESALLSACVKRLSEGARYRTY